MNADQLIDDCIRKIMVAMKEGRLSLDLDQLIKMEKFLGVALDATRKMLARAQTKQTADDPPD